VLGYNVNPLRLISQRQAANRQESAEKAINQKRLIDRLQPDYRYVGRDSDRGVEVAMSPAGGLIGGARVTSGLIKPSQRVKASLGGSSTTIDQMPHVKKARGAEKPGITRTRKIQVLYSINTATTRQYWLGGFVRRPVLLYEVTGTTWSESDGDQRKGCMVWNQGGGDFVADFYHRLDLSPSDPARTLASVRSKERWVRSTSGAIDPGFDPRIGYLSLPYTLPGGGGSFTTGDWGSKGHGFWLACQFDQSTSQPIEFWSYDSRLETISGGGFSGAIPRRFTGLITYDLDREVAMINKERNLAILRQLITGSNYRYWLFGNGVDVELANASEGVTTRIRNIIGLGPAGGISFTVGQISYVSNQFNLSAAYTNFVGNKLYRCQPFGFENFPNQDGTILVEEFGFQGNQILSLRTFREKVYAIPANVTVLSLSYHP
jgi:hypothetical protein